MAGFSSCALAAALGRSHLHRVGEQRRGDDEHHQQHQRITSTSGVVLISAIGALVPLSSSQSAMLASCGTSCA